MDNPIFTPWQDMLPEILHSAGIGLWEIFPSRETTLFHVSEPIRERFGYARGELGGDLEAFIRDCCHPDSRETLRDFLREVGDASGEVVSRDCRIWHKRAERWNWVTLFARSRAGKNPGDSHILGGLQDIHERKIRQQTLERGQLEALQTVELQKAVLEQQIEERTTLLRGVQERVDAILEATSPLQAADAPARRKDADDAPEDEDLDLRFAEELHTAFDAITEKMAWYKAVIDSIPFPIAVTDMNNAWLYANSPGVLAIGASALKDIIGRPARTWNSRAGGSSGERESAPADGHFSFHHDGLDRFFEGRVSSLLDSAGARIGNLETMQDVTELHKADERTRLARNELEKERLLLKQVFDSSPVSMIILVRGAVCFATPFTREFLGITVGGNIHDFLADPREAEAMAEELQRGGALNWRPLRVKSAANGTREMLVTAFSTTYYGEKGLICWLVDVTEMREKELQLRLARDAAEKSARAKSEFLANMSHEIRTPMNAILGIIQIMRHTGLAEKQRVYLDKAEQAGKALLYIINDLLDFSKIEAGKLAMETLPFSLRQVVDGVMDMTAESCREKGLACSYSLPDGLPETLLGDPLRLHQVLLNLISNAVKFTERGSVRLAVTLREQTEGGLGLLFSVADTGIGISSDQAARLFSPFTQADASTTRQYGGTGLGLAICKRLVEMMQGAIWCESEPGKGAVFHFTVRFGLPDAGGKGFQGEAGDSPDAPPEEPGKDPIQAALAALAPFQGTTVLLVDDTPLNLMVAEDLLDIAGIKADTAANGSEALKRLAEKEYPLVFMDVQMPVMDGLAATRELRADPRYAKLPIIAMTALVMQSDKEKTLAAGMNDHIAKPIDALDLYRALARWLAGGATA